MDDLLTAAIQQICIAEGWTVSIAESCTGGSLAARLTRVPGSSQYFLGSIVAYSNGMKQELLGVREESLEEHGAVSSPVVEQMANGVRALTGSDFGLAVTGIAGPGGGNKEKPVGTIWAAIAIKDEAPLVWQFHLTGGRQQIIDQTVEIILNRLLHILQRKSKFANFK